MSDIKTWRYVLPNIDSEGWGVVLLDSTGFFAAVSDYGNYAHGWWDSGKKDFREFFLQAEKDANYFLAKLSRDSEFDADTTVQLIKEYILSHRRERRLLQEEARLEWERADELLADYDERGWCESTRINYAGEFLRYTFPASAKAFVYQLLPRLAAAIAEELKHEREALVG